MKTKMELFHAPPQEEEQANRMVAAGKNLQKIATKNKVVTMTDSSSFLIKVDTLMNHHQGSLINFQQGVYLGEDRTKKTKKNNKEKVVDPYAGVETPPPTNRNYFSSSEEEYFSALEDEEDDEDHDKEMETKSKKKRTLTFSCIGSRKKMKARKH